MASEQECMGLLVSKYFEWDGISVLEVARYGLIDSNFHDESRKIDTMVQDIYRKDSNWRENVKTV
jgi:hypothetical protein